MSFVSTPNRRKSWFRLLTIGQKKLMIVCILCACALVAVLSVLGVYGYRAMQYDISRVVDGMGSSYLFNYMLEIENYDAVKTIINRDYETFSGKMLERYFKRVLMESKAYTRIGSWWDRKGENEIDIVAENELNDEAVFIEVKRKEENFDVKALGEKVDVFTRATGKFKDYTVSQKGLSMTDM